MADIVNKAQTEVVVDGEKAKEQLSVLEQAANDYRKAIIEADKAGDVKAFRQAEKDLKKTNTQLRQIVKSSFDLNRVMSNLSTSGYHDLSKAMREINAELNKPHIVRGSKQYNELTEKLRLVRGEMANLRAEQNLSTASNNKFFGAMQVFLGGAMLKGTMFLKSALGDAINKIRDFEKANVVLAGILGVNKDEMKDLTSSAISLGKTSKYTASQVTELQTELAKLGFEKGEIKEAQKHILNFATALNANLEQAATLAGAALRAFGEDTSQTERYVSAMTMAANKSALGFESLATAMPIVSPIAKAFNFSIEDTLALLGNLSDSGFTAATSATALRNIFLNLADANGKLAKQLGTPVRSLDDLVKGFRNLEAQGIDLAGVLELTDKQSVAAFQTFMQGADKLVPLRDSLIDVGDELERVANDQMDNLDGAILTLQSSWEALMLSFSSSAGPMKTAVDGLSKLLQGLSNIIDKTKLMQDRSYYGEFLDDEYTHAKEVQGNVIAKRKSEGYSPEEAYTRQLERTARDLEDKMKEAEKAKKELDAYNDDRDWKDWILSPIGVYKMKESSNLERAYEVAQFEVDRLEMQKKAIEDLRAIEFKEDTTTITNPKGKGGAGGATETSQRQVLQDALKALEEQHLNEMSVLKKQYLADDTITEEQHKAKLLQQQDAYDEARKAKLKELIQSVADPSTKIDLAKQIADIEAKNLDRQIAERDAKNKAALKQEQDLLKWNEEETQKIIRASFDWVTEQENKAFIEQMERRKRGEISEEVYQQELTRIHIKHLEERMRINGISESEISEMRKRLLEEELIQQDRIEQQRKAIFGSTEQSQMVQRMADIDDALTTGAITFGEAVAMRVSLFADAMQSMVSGISDYTKAANDAEVASINRKYDAQVKAAGRNQKKIAKIEEERDKEVKEAQREGNERSFKIQIAMAYASTAQGAINAYSSTAAIPVFGPALAPVAAGIATAAGLLNVATIKKQHEASSANYWTGGYTPKGDKYRYAGNVHFGEFVANKDTVNNPEANAMLRVIDTAQRNNTSSSLRSTDFARALEYNETVASMPSVSRASSVDGYPNQNNELVASALLRVAQASEKLEERLNKKIVAETYWKGDGGIENQLKKDEKLKRNIGRNG